MIATFEVERPERSQGRQRGKVAAEPAFESWSVWSEVRLASEDKSPLSCWNLARMSIWRARLGVAASDACRRFLFRGESFFARRVVSRRTPFLNSNELGQGSLLPEQHVNDVVHSVAIYEAGESFDTIADCTKTESAEY
jgi:hypothetical protein